MRTDQEIVREHGRHFHVGHTQGNSSPSQAVFSEHYKGNISGPNVEKYTVAINVAVQCEIVRRNQTQQAMHRLCTGSVPCKSYKVIRTRSG